MRRSRARPPGGNVEWRWHLAAVFVFVCALLSLFHGFIGEDLREVVPAYVPPGASRPVEPGGFPLGAGAEPDQHFTIWLVSRNARTFLTRPHRIFQAETCHPASDTLALTEPAISLGLLGMPAYLVTRDPIVTYNFVWLALTTIAALAMYLLVGEWTGVPAAGIVAGLLYAFHAVKLWNVSHPYIDDTGWTVLALWLATRLFERARWRDALGLGLVCALQIGAGLYPLLAAFVLAIPAAAWLAWHHGLRREHVSRLGLVVAMICGAAALVFGPYLSLANSGVLVSRTSHLFMPWSAAGQSGKAFPGWWLLMLALAGAVLPARLRTRPGGGDPRLALLVGGLLVMAMATGGSAGEALRALAAGQAPPPHLPNLYNLLKSVIPGMAVVRVPSALYSGVHLALCALAGLGAAGLLRLAPQRVAVFAAAGLIAVTYVDVLRPRTLGLEPRLEYVMSAQRPSQESLDFYRVLAERGNAGPLFEIPTGHTPMRASNSILLSAYHHRRTSWCYGSFHPPSYERVRALGQELPGREALDEAREMGFTTIVVHHREDLIGLGRRLALFAARNPGELRRVHEDGSMTAWAIEVP